MKRVVTSILVAAFLAASATAWAQEESDDQELTETTYDFADDIVEGSLVRPEGDLIGALQQASTTSLINIREHFIDKMIESADDI
jgi:hypothetical protein